MADVVEIMQSALTRCELLAWQSVYVTAKQAPPAIPEANLRIDSAVCNLQLGNFVGAVGCRRHDELIAN